MHMKIKKKNPNGLMSFNEMFRTIDVHRMELGFGIGSTFLPNHDESELDLVRTPEELMRLLLDYYKLNSELLSEMMFDIINKYPELSKLEWMFISGMHYTSLN